jgi:polyferredoxin
MAALAGLFPFALPLPRLFCGSFCCLGALVAVATVVVVLQRGYREGSRDDFDPTKHR